MNRIVLYAYNTKNLEDIMEEINGQLKVIVVDEIYVELKKERPFDSVFNNFRYIDLSLVMLGDNERTDAWLYPVILLLQKYLSSYLGMETIFLIDKRYAKNVCNNLSYFISGIESFETLLGLDKRVITNIVDLEEKELCSLYQFVDKNLFGNEKLKRRLFEEIRKFRNFNKLGERKIFSVFLCGPSGIGKTETAWLLHEKLAPQERFIKINLGNYSEHNALSSLIGSPRGYIGSSKGELTDKIETSKSRVILIDEFEKASLEIHNFFLELLSDGKFTDSQGREYDLDKYIIIFTSNFSAEEFTKSVSPELRSRFDLKYNMSELSSEEKEAYILFKSKYYFNKVKKVFSIMPTESELGEITCVNVELYRNLRDINRELENRISKFIDEKQNVGGEEVL